MADFATMLKYLRERKHLSQRQLALELGMSASAIGMYESGKRHPNYEDEEAIADFFNVDLNTLRGKRINEEPELDERSKEFIGLFQEADPVVQEAVVNILKSAPRKP